MKTATFCFLHNIEKYQTDLKENFRQYSWWNAEFTYLQIMCFTLNILC